MRAVIGSVNRLNNTNMDYKKLMHCFGLFFSFVIFLFIVEKNRKYFVENGRTITIIMEFS